jgi:hypothetical protein
VGKGRLESHGGLVPLGEGNSFTDRSITINVYSYTHI